MASIEEILVAQAADDYQSQQTIATVAQALGALGGGALGYDLGDLDIKRANAIGAAREGGLNLLGDAKRRVQDMIDPIMVPVDPKASTAVVPYGSRPSVAMKQQPRQRPIANDVPPSLMKRLTPGPRMAGGLIGALMGGALAPEAVKMILGPSEATEMLVKAKMGTLDSGDKLRLQQMIIDNQQATGVI